MLGSVSIVVWRRCCCLAMLALASIGAFGQHHDACRVAVMEGEVRAGQAFERPIGNGLEVLLEPLVSGWIVRVIPILGPRGLHDYAELATPPYRSVTPLLISTDYSFRAQDALAWNPRHFHFAPDSAAFRELERWYLIYDNAAGDPRTRREAETKLAELAASAPEAELTLLDAHLVLGSANQAGTARLVASHPNASAHEVDQPADGRPSLLGHLNTIKFRLRFKVPKGFLPAQGLMLERGACS